MLVGAGSQRNGFSEGEGYCKPEKGTKDPASRSVKYEINSSALFSRISREPPMPSIVCNWLTKFFMLTVRMPRPITELSDRVRVT